ncbi:MAG: rhomboid family intramembrane serine protease [Armatimonadetes bacterium]|nr:rhomboid family intramembrane serine protease [Armatimonadota bacterium]
MSLRQRAPIVTLLLIAANIVAAFFFLVRPDLVDTYGFKASDPSFVTIFTSMFVHANAIHLLGNMVFLAAVGAAVEIATGSLRFLVVYLVSGLFGVTLFWLSVRHNVDVPPLVGASGCISGCAVYYSLRYTKLRVPLAPKASATVAIVTLVWLALQVVGALVRVGDTLPATGFFAHLGGAVGGTILGFVFRAPDLGSRRLGHQVYEALNDQGPAAQIAHLQEHLKSHPGDLEMHLKLAEEYQALGDKKEEAETLNGVLFQLSGEQVEKATLRLLEMRKLGEIPPVRRRQLADKVSESTAAKVLWTIVEMPKSEAQRPEALLDLIGRLREGEPKEASLATDLLLADYPTHSVVEIAKQRGWLA